MRRKIGDKIYNVVTLTYIAKKAEKSVSNLRYLMRENILPEANIRGLDSLTKKGKIMKGYRLYTISLANGVAEVLKTFKSRKPVTEDQKQEIREIFMNEKIEVFFPRKNS